MCYKDRWYCDFWKECKKGIKCNRAITKEVKDLAFKSGLPINHVGFKPDCFKKIKIKL